MMRIVISASGGETPGQKRESQMVADTGAEEKDEQNVHRQDTRSAKKPPRKGPTAIPRPTEAPMKLRKDESQLGIPMKMKASPSLTLGIALVFVTRRHQKQ